MENLHRRLHNLGAHLDEAAPPITAGEAIDRHQRGALGARAPRRTPWIAVAAAVVLVALAVVGGVMVLDGDEGTNVVTAPTSSTTEATTTTSTTTTAPATSTTTGAGTPLPGERVEIYPSAGAELAVVGVAKGDRLNVRSGPGTSFPVAFTLRPLADGVVATGHNRSLGDAGFWSEITVDGRTGWANTSFLLQPGSTDDVTAQWFPAERPRAETMLDMGRQVAELRASEEPPSKIVVVDGPTVGDLGEITVDVIGLGDDSVGGLRLRIFGEPEGGGEGFVLRTVEATSLCSRGVSDGQCV